jgi:hypothetical protein
MTDRIIISSTDIIDANYSNDGKTCQSCGADASNGNNKIQAMYDMVLCAPCGESYLEEVKQRLLKMFDNGETS